MVRNFRNDWFCYLFVCRRVKGRREKIPEIFENSQAGIFTFALTTLRIQEMNGKCAQMLGYDREDLIDKELSRILMDSAERDSFHQPDPEEFGVSAILNFSFIHGRV